MRREVELHILVVNDIILGTKPHKTGTGVAEVKVWPNESRCIEMQEKFTGCEAGVRDTHTL